MCGETLKGEEHVMPLISCTSFDYVGQTEPFFALMEGGKKPQLALKFHCIYPSSPCLNLYRSPNNMGLLRPISTLEERNTKILGLFSSTF